MMYFNAYERWDRMDEFPSMSPTSEPTQQPTFDPTEGPTEDSDDDDDEDDDDDDDDDDDNDEIVERWWNVEICFVWKEDNERFMMERFTYDDPLADDE